MSRTRFHKHLSDFFIPCSQLVNAIVRPPRAEYEIQELGPARFEYGKVPFVRQDGTITNPRGHTLVTGGTDNHLVLVDLRSKGIDGARVERVMELARMASNKNTVPGDKSALVPSGIRMGTPALTSRGFEEADFEQVAEFFDRAVQVATQIKSEMPTKKLKDFLAALPDENANADVLALRNDVKEFALGFPTVGF